MHKDFKIGLIIGVLLVIAGLMWLSTLPSLSIISRFKNLQNSQTNPNLNLTNSSTVSNQAGPSALPSSQTSRSRPAESLKAERPASTQKQQSAIPSDDQISQTTASNQRFHIVMRNQTLSDIARLYYGSPSKWTKIRDANPAVNPDKLSPGTRLFIPP